MFEEDYSFDKEIEKVLVKNIEKYKKSYRDGNQEIADVEYDILIHNLKVISPNHELLNKVEEEEFDKETVKHTNPMLSIEKAFSKDELIKFFNRIENKYGKILYRVTPKLDGMAAIYENEILSTRGDGLIGYNITDAFEKGLVFNNPDFPSEGIGEIVMSKSYFEENLTEHFEHPRNCVVGAIKCDTLNDIQKKTMNDGAIKFVKYNELKCYYNESDYILENLDKIVEDLSTVDYPIDGYVIEVTQKQYGVDDIRKELGNTNHHYKWQIAYKIQGEKKKTTVLDITWQTGRGGNITPVLEIDPVFVSGANISRVTAHNYGYLKNKKIGIGSEIEIIRSGEVIPKIIGLVSNPVDVEYVYQCPVCKEKTILVNDIIKCTNFECNAQIVGRLEHFFKTLKIDLFGEKAIQILVDNGHTKLKNILKLNKNDFIDMGFGEKQSENFEKSINYALLEQYEDWKILASISIPLLGKGDSKKFLKQHYLGEIFDLKIEDIIKIDGFAEKKANAIIEGLRRNEEVLFNLIKNFNIIDSKSEISGSNVLNGNTFVFTGKMEKAREEMMKLCELNGGISLSSITKKTNYLVMGENVGKTKIDKATKYGTITITEKEFMDMLN